eukprot:477644_1
MSGSSQSFYLVSRKHSSVSRKSFKEFKQPTTTTKMPTKKIVDENLDLNGSTSKKRKKRSKKRKKRSKNKSKNKQKTPQSTDLPPHLPEATGDDQPATVTSGEQQFVFGSSTNTSTNTTDGTDAIDESTDAIDESTDTKQTQINPKKPIPTSNPGADCLMKAILVQKAIDDARDKKVGFLLCSKNSTALNGHKHPRGAPILCKEHYVWAFEAIKRGAGFVMGNDQGLDGTLQRFYEKWEMTPSNPNYSLTLQPAAVADPFFQRKIIRGHDR